MSKRDQNHKHNWKRRVKDWLIVPHSAIENPHSVTPEELAKHHTRSDCWIAIDGVVYDVSRFVPYHPGGTKVLEMYAGRDASAPFARSHVTSGVLECILSCKVGRLVESGESGGDEVCSSPPPPGGLPVADAVATAACAETSADEPTSAAGSSWAGLNAQQLLNVVARTQLFPSVSPDALAAATAEALQSCSQEEVDEEAALRELFATLDVDRRGYVTRSTVRDFVYSLDPEGICEEMLLKAPEQITAADFLRLLRHL